MAAADASASKAGSFNKRLLAVLGAITADAAATSTHWVYDVERIAEVAQQNNGGDVAFVPPNLKGAYHDGVMAYFAHKSKNHGDHTYYSEIGLALARSLVAKGELDVQDFQQKLLDAFGFGGTYSGYIPGILRHVLPLLQAGVDKAGPLTGATDDGHTDSTINAALVVLAARFAGSDGYMDKVHTVVRSLCNTERALSAATAVAGALAAVIAGTPRVEALASAFPGGKPEAPEAVKLAADALAAAQGGKSTGGDFKAIAATFGPACDVKHSLPLAIFSTRYTPVGGQDAVPDFKTAVRTNIALSGDTCGRAPLV